MSRMPLTALMAVAVFSTATATVAAPLPWRGVSLAGAEFGEEKYPAIYGEDYIYPSVNSVRYFQSKGMNTVRLPFRWELLQPALYQDLDMAELNRMKQFVAGTTALGVRVILDPHNYARYKEQVVGSAAVPNAAFADFWSRLALTFQRNPNVVFGLMNEPYDMPTEQWLNAANAAISAIRATGATNWVTVPGNAWSGAWTWESDEYGTPNAEAMLGIRDPARHMVFEVHQYLDEDASGTHSACVNAGIGVERVSAFTQWLRRHGYQALLGEFAGANNTTCRQATTGLLSHLQANADVWVGWTWWAAGPWWGNYMFSLEPRGTQDRPQMQWLAPYLKSP